VVASKSKIFILLRLKSDVAFYNNNCYLQDKNNIIFVMNYIVLNVFFIKRAELIKSATLMAEKIERLAEKIEACSVAI
jgi:hypothetical protein